MLQLSSTKFSPLTTHHSHPTHLLYFIAYSFISFSQERHRDFLRLIAVEILFWCPAVVSGAKKIATESRAEATKEHP
jgi:hypothetical protein